MGEACTKARPLRESGRGLARTAAARPARYAVVRLVRLVQSCSRDMDTEFKIQLKGFVLSDADRQRLLRAIREATLREVTQLDLLPERLRIEMGDLIDGIVVRRES